MNVDAARFGVVMEKIAQAARDGMVDPHYGTLSYQGRMLLERIMKFTPAKSEDQQRAAIRRDVLKMFQLRRPETIAAVIKKVGRGPFRGMIHDHLAGVHVDLKTSGAVLTIAEMRAIHKRQYTRRGRVRTIPERYLVSPVLFTEYVEMIYEWAGKAKAGWLPAASRLFAANIPGWVLRHAPGRGFFDDGRNDVRPYIEARNTTQWSIDREEGERIVGDAIRARVRDMDTYVETQMRLRLMAAGFKVA